MSGTRTTAKLRKDPDDMILLKLETQRFDVEKGRPNFPVFDNHNDAPNKESFTKATPRLFHQDSACKSDDLLPKIIRSDPGQKNIDGLQSATTTKTFTTHKINPKNIKPNQA